MGVGYQFGEGCFWGLLSAMTAPIGAMVGLKVDPSNRTKSFMIAFGAGALLFALTVELFGKALEDIDAKDDTAGKRNAYLMIFFAVLGAYFFRWVNRKLNQPESMKQALKDIQGFIPVFMRRIKLLVTLRFQELFYDQVVEYEQDESKVVPVVPSIIIEDTTGMKPNSKTHGRSHAPEKGMEDITQEVKSPLIASAYTHADVPEEEEVTPLFSGNKRPGSVKYTKSAPEEEIRIGAQSKTLYTAEQSVVIHGGSDSDEDDDGSDEESVDGKASKRKNKRTDGITRDESDDSDVDIYVEPKKYKLEEDDVDVYQPTTTTSHDKPNVGLAIWLGLMIDGIPESIIIGVMSQSEEGMSISFIVGVFLSNFPEAMSSAGLMLREGHSTKTVLALWWGLFFYFGISAGISAALIPSDLPGAWGPTMYSIEGIAAGAMLTVIAQTMIPEAFELGGDLAGPATLFGFLSAMLSYVLFDAGGDDSH